MFTETQIQHLYTFIVQIWNDGAQSTKMTDEDWAKYRDALPERLYYSLRHVLADLDDFPEEPVIEDKPHYENNVVYVDFTNGRKI